MRQLRGGVRPHFNWLHNNAMQPTLQNGAADGERYAGTTTIRSLIEH